MPEGDTIFRSATVLHRALAGQKVTRFESALAPLASVRLAGRRIDGVTARGKHLLFSFGGELLLRTHMRMSGSWHLYRPGERWRRPASLMRVLIATDAFEAVAFGVHDAEFVRARDLERGAAGRLGPDLLGEPFDVSEVLRRLRVHGDVTIADALLDQRVAAGVGNVFKSEVLFLARLHPDTLVSDLGEIAATEVFAIARAALGANVARDGPPAVTAARRTTGRLAPSESLWVYGRGGRPCRRCGVPIEWRRQGPDARSTYWCPSCQRRGPGHG